MAYGSNTKEFKLTVTEIDAYSVEVYWEQRSVIRNGSSYTVGVLNSRTSTVNKNRCRVTFVDRYTSTDKENTVAVYHNNELIGYGIDYLNMSDDNVAVSAYDAYGIIKLLIPSSAADTGGGGSSCCDPILINWSDFLTDFAGGTLTSYSTYAISAPDGFSGATLYVKSLGAGTIDTKAELYDIFGSLFKTLQVDLAVVDGTFASYSYNRIYDPVANIEWYGHPDLHGTNSRLFFDAFFSATSIGDEPSYTSIVVNHGSQFSGSVPSYCMQWEFGRAIHTFGTNVQMWGGHTIDLDSGSHVFPNSSTISSGTVGGRGCSAELVTVIDLGGGSTLDLSAYPLCKTYHITNVDAGGLTDIVGWNLPENHGAEITIEGSLGVNLLTGNIMSSTNTSVTSGGAFATVNEWAKLFLHNNGNAYLIDYI